MSQVGNAPSVSEMLSSKDMKWVVTGAAGFIGSNLVEALLRQGQRVTGLDDLSTGKLENVEDVKASVGPELASRLDFHCGSVLDAGLCDRLIAGADVILHQAALGSVPRSIERPLATLSANVDGFIQIIDAARRAGVKRIVYASSSSVYGDSPVLPKSEEHRGNPLSPYAASKQICETLAEAYSRTYPMKFVGLRYFNVFGSRQDPAGAYAAVIPRWINALLNGDDVDVYGDGETSRDFCHVQNVIQANIRAALVDDLLSSHEIFNIACGAQTTLNKLVELLQGMIASSTGDPPASRINHRDFRAGDVRHSLADISKAGRLLGYSVNVPVQEGLNQALPWYINRFAAALRK